MKLPRWLVIAMLASSVLLVLAATAWWWVTWPERTAREFVELIAAHKWDEARRMIRSAPTPRPAWIVLEPELDSPGWAPWKIQPASRTLWDVLCARQQFQLREGQRIEVERGTIDAGMMQWVLEDFVRKFGLRTGESSDSIEQRGR